MAELTVAQHWERAKYHTEVGKALLDVEHEWAAVALFYSGYHHVKAAFLRDPVFDDPQRLSALRDYVTPDDRYVSRHKARKRSAGVGVNNLVTLLYPKVTGDYERLHQMSIDVRYGTGLRSGAMESLPDVFSHLETAALNGELKYSN